MATRSDSRPPSQKRPPRDVPGAKNPYIRTRKPNKPKLEPHLTTLWSYPSQHYGNREQGSRDYRGATPSWVIWEVIQRFTEPGGIVVDPFCGSGTTLDVCKDTDGRGGGSTSLRSARTSKKQMRAIFHWETKARTLSSWTRPTPTNLTYSDSPRCIGKTRANDGTYAEAMSETLIEANRILRPGGALAIYVQDIWHEKQKQFFPLGLMLAEIGRTRFSLVDHVCVVRNNETLSRGNYRTAAKERGFMLRGFNHLLLFRKERRSTNPLPLTTPENRPSKASPKKSTQKKAPRKGKGARNQSRTRNNETAQDDPFRSSKRTSKNAGGDGRVANAAPKARSKKGPPRSKR